MHLHTAVGRFNGHAPVVRSSADRDEEIDAVATWLGARTADSMSAPASALPGEGAVVNADGIVQGWIGGGCAQPAVLRTVRLALQDGRARMIRIAPAEAGAPVDQRDLQEVQDDVLEFGMSFHSGGTLELFIDPMLPRARLTVIGDSPVAVALVGLASRVGLQVTAMAQGADALRFVDAEQLIASDDAAVVAAQVAPSSFVVVAIQGPRDLQDLRATLALQARQIWFVASARKAQVLRESLIEAGQDADAVRAIIAPAGQLMGAQTPEEIALSVLAAVVATRRSGQRARVAAKPPCRCPIRRPSRVRAVAAGTAATTTAAQPTAAATPTAPAARQRVLLRRLNVGCVLKGGGSLYSRMTVGAVLLAAGSGSRMGGTGGRPKALLELGGVPLILPPRHARHGGAHLGFGAAPTRLADGHSRRRPGGGLAIRRLHRGRRDRARGAWRPHRAPAAGHDLRRHGRRSAALRPALQRHGAGGARAAVVGLAAARVAVGHRRLRQLAMIPRATRSGRLCRRSHYSGPFPCPGIAGSCSFTLRVNEARLTNWPDARARRFASFAALGPDRHPGHPPRPMPGRCMRGYVRPGSTDAPVAARGLTWWHAGRRAAGPHRVGGPFRCSRCASRAITPAAVAAGPRSISACNAGRPTALPPGTPVNG